MEIPEYIDETSDHHQITQGSKTERTTITSSEQEEVLDNNNHSINADGSIQEEEEETEEEHQTYGSDMELMYQQEEQHENETVEMTGAEIGKVIHFFVVLFSCVRNLFFFYLGRLYETQTSIESTSSKPTIQGVTVKGKFYVILC